MCGRFDLKTKYDSLPKILKDSFHPGFESKYETQNLIKPTDPVLVIRNEVKLKTTFKSWGFISPWVENPLTNQSLGHFNLVQRQWKKINYSKVVGDIKDF